MNSQLSQSLCRAIKLFENATHLYVRVQLVVVWECQKLVLDTHRVCLSRGDQEIPYIPPVRRNEHIVFEDTYMMYRG
jgi:hypothetical protein